MKYLSTKVILVAVALFLDSCVGRKVYLTEQEKPFPACIVFETFCQSQNELKMQKLLPPFHFRLFVVETKTKEMVMKNIGRN